MTIKRKKKTKCIEVVEGYASVGDTGHIHSEVKYGLIAWQMPIIYKENPNPDNFRKVRITYAELI